MTMFSYSQGEIQRMVKI